MPITAFRRALRKARLARSMTEQEIAAAVGVSVRSWQSYEAAGGRSPPLARLASITCTLGPGPINALLEGTGYLCEQHGSRDDLIRRWIKLSEDFLADARALVGE